MHARQLLTVVLAAAALACSSEKSPGPQAARLVSLQVLPAAAGPLTVPLGGSVRFTASGTYSDGETRDLTASVVWSSSAPAVVAISNAAGSAGVATAAALGTSDVSATDPETGSTARAPVEVVAAQVVSLAVSPLAPTLLVGSTLQLAADATLTDETVADLAASVTWTSSDPAIATVSPNGLVTAVAVGVATITAKDPVSLAEATTTVEVTAVPAALSYLALSRGSAIGGGTVQITGTVALTSPAEGLVVVTLASSDEAAATVPASVTVPAGADRATFAVTTFVVARRTKVTLTATRGEVTKSATLNVRVAR